MLACVRTCETCDDDHVGTESGMETVPAGVLHERGNVHLHSSDGWMHLGISTDQVQALQVRPCVC